MNTIDNDELTADEIKLIQVRRARKNEQQSHTQKTQKLLMLAYTYEKWLNKHGRGSSFSTFVDEFNYQDGDASETYKIIQNLRHAAAKRIPYNPAASLCEEPTIPPEFNEHQLIEKAFSFARQLEGMSVTQALYILKELTPQLITNSHTVSGDVMAVAEGRLSSGGSF